MQTRVMAILNVTPDSFYDASRISSTGELVVRARQALTDGASILDIGGCSTRPGGQLATEEEEWSRVAPALSVLREELPEASLSLDTFRPEIARRALQQFGAMIINDVSGGSEEMYDVVRTYSVPYVWTFRGDWQRLETIDRMADMQLILDPGFGFIGGVEQDYACLRQLERLRPYGRDVLVGVSRKSMIWRPLGITPAEALPATQVLHLYALQHGATILRAHDVRAAAHTIELYNRIEIIE